MVKLLTWNCGVRRAGDTCWGERWIPTPEQGVGENRDFPSEFSLIHIYFVAGRGNQTSI